MGADPDQCRLARHERSRHAHPRLDVLPRCPWQAARRQPGLGLELANSIALVDSFLRSSPCRCCSRPGCRARSSTGVIGGRLLHAAGPVFLSPRRAFGATAAIAVCAAGFALITPAFFFRLSLHMGARRPLADLAALWLYAREQAPRWWTWPLLMLVTAGTHIYLLAMVARDLACRHPVALAHRPRPHRPSRPRTRPRSRRRRADALSGRRLHRPRLGRDRWLCAYRLNLLFPVIDYGVWSKADAARAA